MNEIAPLFFQLLAVNYIFPIPKTNKKIIQGSIQDTNMEISNGICHESRGGGLACLNFFSQRYVLKTI